MSVYAESIQRQPRLSTYSAPCFIALDSYMPNNVAHAPVVNLKKSYIPYRVLLRTITSNLSPDKLHKTYLNHQHANVRAMDTFMNRGP